MARIFISLLLIITSLSTFGQSGEDHLEPAEGYFNMYKYRYDYYPFIYKHLIKDLSDRPIARMLTLPSFEPENVLSIEAYNHKGKGYKLIYRVCKESIWYKQDKDSVEVVEYEKEIDSTMAGLIEMIFQKVLLETKYFEDSQMGLDGVNYIFSGFNGYFGIRAGEVWSPSKGTKMYELVLIGDYLIELAKSDNDTDSLVFKNAIMRQGEKLLKRLEDE